MSQSKRIKKTLKKLLSSNYKSWKAKYNVFIYFQINLLRCIQQSRQMKQTRKINLLKTRCRCNGKVIVSK